ncbi:SSU ribosomal protein S30P / sigma 54 modulation protein (plasmid) [Azospirillum sp. B510]|uniref:HPF/RaiA family ribosome-associated protein n=1 Tax=Azospirillum sp. (strain B510) TaxID=137722 RepID=UPI0001C4CD24|nr:HPF/RaiA family ribosome-associated protein [Azospirillum sp. B510]BAI74955.1 SSU ribosomal protein S30P / sigma 54 modulation protein [Azospirillum sp. B510]
MRQPLQIAFRNIDPSPALDHLIREHADKLDRFFGRIMAKRVVFEVPHRHQHQGKQFTVQVSLTVPGDELVVHSGKAGGHGHESADAAIRDAFDAARRALERFAERHRHEVKEHGPVPDAAPDAAPDTAMP